ncbi:hypothetical protein A9Q99_10660 [Gammaproteobacteria bacterium 45_16_T64]|nr:hypothetical protein A9Q99_10660 [Gammaproteobacteria bacterium 45_16_T64]
MSTNIEEEDDQTVHTILIIDDDRFIQKFLSRAMTGKYTPLCADNGQEGIEIAKESHPDVILLDVEMPGLNGYEVCDKLRLDPVTSDIPVIFLSGKSSIRERLIGYEAGAVDFLTKPCEKEELLAKINVHCIQKKNKESLENIIESVSGTAHAAIAGSGELGRVIQFMEQSANVATFSQLSEALFQVTRTLSLNCCLYFCSATGNVFHSSLGEVTPLEKELMLALFEEGNRFHDFGCRTQINYPRVSLLIKNMPLDNMEVYGRYKDLLPSLLSSTNSKVKSIDTENALIQQGQSLGASFDVVNSTLTNLSQSLNSAQEDVIVVMKDMLAELADTLPSMGLEDDQETYLLDRIDLAVHQSIDLSDQATNIYRSFETVTRLLQHLSDRQHEILDIIFTRIDDEDDNDNDSIDSSDVELF